MGKWPAIIAAVGALWTFSASAGEVNTQATSESSITLTQLDDCVGPDRPDCRRDPDFHRNRRVYDYDRDQDWRYQRDAYGCRDVTIRERRGEEIIVRHRRRCD